MGPLDRNELSPAADIFGLAFADEHASRYREGARPSAFREVWAFLLTLEPSGFLAARENGRLVGYAIFTSSLKGVQRRAITSGAVLRLGLAALRGGFALQPRALGRILLNKILFVRSAGRYRSGGDAQLLNVAVHPDARGRGIASALLREGMSVMRSAGVSEVRLEVRPANRAAVRLYERTGWREAGRTHDLEGEWLVMVVNP